MILSKEPTPMVPITHLHLRQRPMPTITSERDSFLAYCRDRLNLAPNTLDAYRYDLTAAAVILAGPLETITTHDVEAYLATRREKAGTTNRRIVSLRRFSRGPVGRAIAHPIRSTRSKPSETTRIFHVQLTRWPT